MMGAPSATPGRFRPSRAFLESPFERRFQGGLREARASRSWCVVAATMGSGKSLGIGDLVIAAGGGKGLDGRTALPVLSICAPKNGGPESRFGRSLAAAFGYVPRLSWGMLRPWLVAEFHRSGVELLIIDDAHDLAIPHLMLLKELTDQLAAPPYGRQLGLALVCASEKGEVPLQGLLDTREGLLWRQFRRRFPPEPYRYVRGHSQEELRELCVAYEHAYQDQFPSLNLRRWYRTMYTYLTHPLIDLEGQQRVTMQNFLQLLDLALAACRARGCDDITPEALQAAADVLTLRRDAVVYIDGEPGADGVVDNRGHE